MTKKRVGIVLTIIVTLLLCFGMITGCQNERAAKTTYTIKVMSEGENSLSDIEVRVYKDSQQESMVWAAETDEEGIVSFEAEQSETYVAVLQEVPDGYQAEEFYPIKEGQTEIQLESVLVDGGNLTGVTYELGDAIHDFEVIAVDGTVYKLSELLKEKKAVVLNFWFINCGPCKMEFPYLQQAYEEYKDAIEVIAINPVDGTNDSIATFAQDNVLTFPMAVGDAQWESWMKLTAYPTTVIIDRYGTIGMIHKGMVTDKAIFTKVFEYFCSDDYEQTTIRNIDDIE